ncbi:MAG: DUF3293 domain-containing protein [Pseudomonadota bacterium]|nr:DUF3293 domain-containing protein [Pseudomonadota bacterium]
MREFQIVDAAGLATAYAAAQYVVMLDGDTLRLRVGEPAADVEAYWTGQRYVFITAWNPASEPHSDTANMTADTLLVTQLDAMGLRRQSAWAESPDSSWREPGWLVADPEPSQSDTLAQEFGQAGILAWRRGEPVRLRMLVPRPPNAEPLPCVDWVDD